MIAALPMYDWPEVRAATDRLWRALRDALRARGVAAPDALTRDRPLDALWRAPDLLLAQACGLPLVRGLAAHVTVLGVANYAVPGCPPGFYRSAVVVRADDPRERLAAFRGAILAYSDPLSQSGFGAIHHHAAPLARDGRFFAAARATGAHRASVAAVAAGAADIAAIDYVSWRLARRFCPEAVRLRVLMLTDPTPGLPYITARGNNAAPLRAAVATALAALDADTRSTLGIAGHVPLAAADYALITTRADLCLPPASPPGDGGAQHPPIPLQQET